MWKFSKRPDVIWALTLGVCLSIGIICPSTRFFVAIAFILHALLLLFGIFNLRLRFFCDAYCSSPHAANRLALTFDDGPDPVLTPLVLDVLKQYGFTGTFFCIGRNVARHPNIARRIVEEGHTIGCHDLEHRTTENFRRKKRMIPEIGKACTLIADATGKHPRLYRPPVGLSNPHLRPALRSLAMECIGWNRSIGDAGNRIAGRLKKMPLMVHPGAVLLLHDCLPVPEYLDQFLEHFKTLCDEITRRHLVSVSVDTLLGLTPYHDSH